MAALDKMTRLKVTLLPVLSADGSFNGVITRDKITSSILKETVEQEGAAAFAVQQMAPPSL